jgi:hypothetical protein
MGTETTRLLLVAAAFVSGLLAGGNIDRAIVAMPAWQQVGAAPWAEFSRHADLGNGLWLYPIEAIGGAFTLAAAASYYFDRISPLPSYKAAPIMLGLGEIKDPAGLQAAFEGFRFWGNMRGASQVLQFAALLWTFQTLAKT